MSIVQDMGKSRTQVGSSSQAQKKRKGAARATQGLLPFYPLVPQGEVTFQECNLDLSPQEAQRFEKLKKRPIKGHRYLDFELIGELGLGEQIRVLAASMCWETFISFHEPAYRGITLEFLSTVHADPEGHGSLTFQLAGERRDMTSV